MVIMYNIPMSWRNLAEGKAGELPAGDWLPEISECGIDGVVCVAGSASAATSRILTQSAAGWESNHSND